MNIEADNLKKFYQAYVASKTSVDRKNCPSPRAIHKTIISSFPLRRKKLLIDHISKCAYCKNEFFLLLELKGYENAVISEKNLAPELALSSSNSSDVISLPSYFMKFAMILIGFVLIAFSFIHLKQKEDYSRVQRTRNSVVKLINPTNEHLLHFPPVFRWKDYPNAKYYILELFDDALLPIWTSPKIGGSDCILPREVFSSLKKYKYYFWMITAFSNLEKISESDLASFFTFDR